MKKLTNLLLLGGLLFLGVQNAWGYNYLSGTMNNWSSSSEDFKFTGSNPETVTVNLPAFTSYQFKIVAGELWFGNKGTIDADMSESWKFVTGDDSGNGDCTLFTRSAGDYIFKVWWDNGTPYVMVTYPSDEYATYGYTVSFDNSDSWSNVYAYAFTGYYGGFFGAWPGSQVTDPTDGIYTKTTSLYVTPENIIWNNGDGTQTSDLEFHNGATYTKVEDNWAYYYHLTVGTQGWASMYLDFPAKVPANATAYYASDVTNTSVVLTAIEAGSVIPEKTAVVVKAAAGSYDFYYDANTPVTISTNKFAGKIVAETVSASTVYVLSPASTTSTCVFGLYTGTTLGANKAYMLASDRPALAPAIDRISFVIEGENNATDVRSIEANETTVKFFENGQLFIKKNGVVCDVTGRAVK